MKKGDYLWKQELGRYEDLKYQMEENKIELNTQIKKLEIENNYLKDLKLLIENEKIENETQIVNHLQLQKKFFLNAMFI